MLPVLLGLLLWLPALVGLGARMLKFLESENVLNDEEVLSRFSIQGFLGIATAGSLALLVNFAFPVNGLVSLAIWLLGVLSLVRGPARMPKMGLWPLIFVLTLAVAWLSAREFRHGDTGFYHWQAVKWAASAPVVPGLAHLNPWFGHNSTWWLFTAALGLPGLTVHTANLVGGTILFFSLTLLAGSLRGIWNGRVLLGDVMVVTASYLIIRQGLGANTPGISTSMAANLLILVTAYVMASSFGKGNSGLLDAALLLAVFAATVKLQALPLLILTGLCWAVRLFKEGKLPGNSACRAAGVSTLVLVLWMGRGILVSGYPLFPAAFPGFPQLPWALSETKVNGYRTTVGSWHLRGLEGGSLTDKIGLWVANQQGMQNVVFLVIAACAFLVLCAVVILRRWKGSRHSGDSIFLRASGDFSLPAAGMLLAMGLGGLVYCALLAPAFQYASGYFFIVAGVAMAVALLLAGWTSWSKAARGSVLVVIVAAAFALNGGWNSFSKVELLGWPKFPDFQTGSFTTADGLEVRYSPDGGAWDSPLPTAIAVEPALGSVPAAPGRLPIVFFVYQDPPAGR